MSHYLIKKEFFNEAISQIQNRVVYNDAMPILQLLGSAKPFEEKEAPVPVKTEKQDAKQEVKS